MPATAADLELADEVAACYADPLRFVQMMYPWGEPGPLQHHGGPDVWQARFLRELGAEVAQNAFDGQQTVMPVRRAVSSGHGIGKSVMAAWLVHWLMSTRPHCQGVVTANTNAQLETKTWAAVIRWLKLCLTSHWYVINSARMYHRSYRESWFCTPQTCKEENSEAFAGQHAADSSSFYIFDEASAVPDIIHEVAEGGLTDGEPFIIKFGNPTRNSGEFHKGCFGSDRALWHPTIVDARDAKFTNKTLHAQWLEKYGEDSDFFRVRVKGLPPNASDLQYISSALVYAAQRRPAVAFDDDPLLCGLDVARGGSDDCTFRFRRGHDARSIPPIRIPGEQARDSMRLVTVATDILGRTYDGRAVQILFVDGTAIGGPICDRLKQLGHQNVVEVQFGAASPDPKYANMRAYMWSKGREWLAHGAIDPDPQLETDLTQPGYHHDKADRLVLESKEDLKARGVDSPDDADALFLTFAQAVKPKKQPKPVAPVPRGWSWT